MRSRSRSNQNTTRQRKAPGDVATGHQRAPRTSAPRHKTPRVDAIGRRLKAPRKGATRHQKMPRDGTTGHQEALPGDGATGHQEAALGDDVTGGQEAAPGDDVTGGEEKVHQMICKAGNYVCPLCGLRFRLNQAYGSHVKAKECRVSNTKHFFSFLYRYMLKKRKRNRYSISFFKIQMCRYSLKISRSYLLEPIFLTNYSRSCRDKSIYCLPLYFFIYCTIRQCGRSRTF